MTRPPAVAGMFYEGSKDDLMRSVEKCFTHNLGPGSLPKIQSERAGNVVGLVCPHAGYVYSGPGAAHSYFALAEDGIPDTAVILGPNHHGLGAPVSVSGADAWQTPIGEVEVDSQTAGTIVENSSYAGIDDFAHIREHSIEVQLPFLQYIGGDKVKIVPIALAHLRRDDALELLSDLSKAIVKSIEGKNAIVIASTDFTHYESKSTAESRDAMPMERIEAMDSKGLVDVVYDQSITMCGAVGTAVTVEVCKQLGAKSANRLTYYTSGDITGDTAQVVGYGAFALVRG